MKVGRLSRGGLQSPIIHPAMNSITCVYVQSDGTSGLLFVSAAALLKGQELQSPRLWPCSCCSSWWWPVVVQVQLRRTQEEGTVPSCCPPASRSLACFTTPVPQPPGPAPRSASCRRSSRLARVVQHSQRSGPRLILLAPRATRFSIYSGLLGPRPGSRAVRLSHHSMLARSDNKEEGFSSGAKAG